MFLVDTDVLSESTKRRPDAVVAAWWAAQRSGDIFLSVMSVGEIERGIEKQREHDPVFASALADWLDRMLVLYGDRVLPVDLAVARRWGRLTESIGNRSVDLLIAATAIERGLAVVTRNVAHFAPTGVGVIDPSKD